MDGPEVHETPLIRVLNLRGDQSVEAGLWKKMTRVLAYYRRLIGYAFTAEPRVFHILWNNKFELFDRTALMLFYKLLGSVAKIQIPANVGDFRLMFDPIFAIVVADLFGQRFDFGILDLRLCMWRFRFVRHR